jgi:hypothetical protein
MARPLRRSQLRRRDSTSANKAPPLIERVEEQIANPQVQESGQVVRVGSAVSHYDAPAGTISIHGSTSIGGSPASDK